MRATLRYFASGIFPLPLHRLRSGVTRRQLGALAALGWPAIIAKPANPAARALIAWLLGSEAQRLVTEAMFFGPVNARADIATASLARLGAPPAMAARRMEMDWVTVTSILDQITAEWRRRKLGGH
jgi:ABC-type Fe3+ transport system substrate-binding protein